MDPYVFPGFSLHDELALLVEAGLPPMAALQAATVNAARFMDRRIAAELSRPARSPIWCSWTATLSPTSTTAHSFARSCWAGRF